MTDLFNIESGQAFLAICLEITLFFLIIAFIMTLIRLKKGPTLSDRILALDVLVSLGIGFIGVMAIKTGHYLYLDIALALGLVGFLATVAFARYVLMRKAGDDSE